MKGLPCQCLCPAQFWQVGSRFMAEGSRTQAPGKGLPLSIQHLRAQYEGLRQQQKAQAHLVVLPKGGNTPAPAESMISAVWINKERSHSLSSDKMDPEAAGMLVESDTACLQAPESPWHTHLQLHCLVQTVHQEAGHQVKCKGMLMGSEQSLPHEGGPGLFENKQMTQQQTIPEIPEAAQPGCLVTNTQTKAVGSGLTTGIHCPSSTKNPHRSRKIAHYPFPQRKAPRISQAARNLGLYGPS